MQREFRISRPLGVILLTVLLAIAYLPATSSATVASGTDRYSSEVW